MFYQLTVGDGADRFKCHSFEFKLNTATSSRGLG